MFSLFRKRRPAPVFDAPLAPDAPFAVIGDIHGADRLLDKLLEKLDAIEDLQHIVCVGDYVDRGDNGAAVVRKLASYQRDNPDRLICLMGNHERMMLDFLDAPSTAGRRWQKFGGMQTLGSFGVPPVPESAPEADFLTARDRLESALGRQTEDWLRALPLSWQSGNVAVVHAAADPATPLPQQEDTTLLWGHGDFEGTPRSDGVWVAHGHTIVRTPFAENGRIATDTGAYATGKLTAAVVRSQGVEFIQT